MFWEVEGIKHSCVVPVTVWISACVIWVAPYFPLVFPLSLNFTSSFIVMQIEKYVVGFVSIHFHDFWHLSVRKTHFTPSVWMNLRWFVSFCHVYFRFQYLTLLPWCVPWRRSSWVFFLMAIQWPQCRLSTSLRLLLTEAGLNHALAVLTPSLLWWTRTQSCLPSRRAPPHWCQCLPPCYFCPPQQLQQSGSHPMGGYRLPRRLASSHGAVTGSKGILSNQGSFTRLFKPEVGPGCRWSLLTTSLEAELHCLGPLLLRSDLFLFLKNHLICHLCFVWPNRIFTSYFPGVPKWPENSAGVSILPWSALSPPPPEL